jgi:hypothetical protein
MWISVAPRIRDPLSHGLGWYPLRQITKRRWEVPDLGPAGTEPSMRAVFAIYLVAPLVGLAIFVVIGLLGR